jgi:hypothetical protein
MLYLEISFFLQRPVTYSKYLHFEYYIIYEFIFQSPGSCYLFHCGSPDDFKCKFTKHHNYTSAVLAINRHMTELENQIKLTKHEHELTKLR